MASRKQPNDAPHLLSFHPRADGTNSLKSSAILSSELVARHRQLMGYPQSQSPEQSGTGTCTWTQNSTTSTCSLSKDKTILTAAPKLAKPAIIKDLSIALDRAKKARDHLHRRCPPATRRTRSRKRQPSHLGQSVTTADGLTEDDAAGTKPSSTPEEENSVASSSWTKPNETCSGSTSRGRSSPSNRVCVITIKDGGEVRWPAKIFVWEEMDTVVVSDIDGTITK